MPSHRIEITVPKWRSALDAARSFFRRFRPHSQPSISPNQIRILTGKPVRNLALYEQALRHRSLLRNEPSRQLESNERLEFLGDAVLGLAVAEFLFDRYPDRNEGFLTRTRSKLVSGKAISKYAKTMGLGNLIQMSDDMERAGGRNNATLLANAFEAILGALYLDHGLDAARDFTLHTIDDQVNLTELVSRKENYKSMLLEYAQACGWKQPRYQVVEEKGPSHQREFTVDVLLNNEALGRGIGRSKKSAEQRAAREAMLNLKDRKKKEGKPPSS